MKTLQILLLVALLCGAGTASFLWQRNTRVPLKPVDAEVGLRGFPVLLPLPESPKLILLNDQNLAQARTEHNFLLPTGTETLRVELPAGAAKLQLMDRHRSSASQTVELSLTTPDGIVVSVYEGGKGLLVPKYLGTLPTATLEQARAKSLAGGGAMALLVFVFLAALERKSRGRSLG